MNETEAKQIARKYYNDPFARLIKNGKRGWVFGPSILTSGVGGCTLIIEKHTGKNYEIPSAFVGYHELALEDFDERLGLFHWPDEGGVPHPNREKLLLRKIADTRAIATTGDAEHVQYLAELLAELGRDIYLFKHHDEEAAENCLREAVDIQRKHFRWRGMMGPVDKYVWFLHRQKRTEEANRIEAEFKKYAETVAKPTPAEEAVSAAESSGQQLIHQGQQLMEQALDAEENGNMQDAVRLYNAGIEALKEVPRTAESEFGLLLGYYALGSLHLRMHNYLGALQTLGGATALYKSSAMKDPLRLTVTACVQLMAQCLMSLGRESELEDLAKLDE